MTDLELIIKERKPIAEARRPFAKLEAELEADSEDSEQKRQMATGGGYHVGASALDRHYLTRQEEKDLLVCDLFSDSQPDEESPFEF